MPENKFDLNKALQAAKLYNKIDYGNLYVPDVQQTTDNFENWRKSQGYKTEEEKKKQLEEEKKKALAKSSQIWADLGNSEDVYAWYNAHESNPEKQAEFQRNGEMVAGIGSTIATLPFTAGMMGWVPAITTTATGAAGGYAGAYGGQQLGQYLDNRYGWNTTPWLSTVGGLAGGILGGGLGYKGLVRLGTNGRLVRGSVGKKFKDSALWGDVFKNDVDDKTIQLAIKNGKLKFAPESEFIGYHQSEVPLTKFKFPYNRWDVKTHGADPNVAFLTLDSPATSGFLSERPYISTFRVRSAKPAIQSGEIHGMTKNGIRNKIVQWAKQNGADALLLDGIADNRLQNQRILMAFDNSDIKFIGGPGKVKYFGPTMGKTTLVKTNNNYVDLDQLVKPLRKQIADKLGLQVSDPKVAKSPEYQTALKQLIEEFQTNADNAGKTLVGSQKQLLNGDFVLDGEPMLPDFETFVARNQARGFKETPEQLRVWYDEILGLKPDIKVDNRYVSEIVYGKPSKLTLAERMGIPKGDRGNLTQDQLEGLEDLMHYNTNGKYRWRLTYNDKTGFARTTAANRPEGSVPGVKALLDAGAKPDNVIRYTTKTGNWNVWANRTKVPATFSGGDFPVPEGMGWAPGDLSLMLDGNSGKGLKVVMTSPRVDLANNWDDVSQTLLESLPNTIDKNIMRRFWQNNDQVVLPGSYLSGDNGTLPLGLNGISAIDQGKGMSGAISEILHPAHFRPHGSGLSPDSMLSILKQGQRPGHAVRYGPGFTQLNNSAVYNKHIYDAWSKYKAGAMSADEFKTIFDDWFVPQGGRPLEIRTPNKFRWARNNDGTKTLVQQEQTPYIVFPHPYVHYKKKGGKIENPDH